MYDKFFENLLPGNYALTKSMELTKVSTSGSLWYTKKFLVLYYYIFLTNDIYTREYINKIINSFDNYIESLDPIVKAEATEFFYGSKETINFKSEKFKTFNSFIDVSNLNNSVEKQLYDCSARKYYFALLMGAGGQAGIKKMLKEKIQEESFVFTDNIIQDTIFNSAIKISTEQVNSMHRISDNSVKYILSSDAIKNIINDSKKRQLTIEDVRNIAAKYPHSNPNYNGIRNDLIAFIRNERQILYYYGFFHSKSLGATDFEFSSLTPIGQAALNANYYEFLSIWEHQKIKMISQPATADINDVPTLQLNADRFSISYTPYLDVIGTILRRGSLSVDEYMYIVSRRNHLISEKDWIANEEAVFINLSSIKAKISSFGRNRDIKEEDGRKELWKYVLGLRSDLPLDKGTNPIGFCKYNPSKKAFVPEDEERLKELYEIYLKLNIYKLKINENLFRNCEKDLRKRYVGASNNFEQKTDARIKIKWDLYNIHLDKFISLTTIFCVSSAACKVSFLRAKKNDVKLISDFAFNNFKNMLKTFGIKTLKKVISGLNKVMRCLNSNDYSEFIDISPETQKQNSLDYKKESISDLFTKIKNISVSYALSDAERQRNSSLICLLKTYYMARFMENDSLKCECCGKETFITENEEPYIEFHHLIPFNIALGPDHYLNLYALCPNCHSKLHFLRISNKEQEYQNINKNNYLKSSIVDRLKLLKEERILCSYHLEYLLADKAITEDQFNTIAA
ncbi:MAG: HNH endonuclease [Anaeroplasmataceae bacterium]|nr:HNH endonuclease [Anaeroplasmataceae bacterium]